MAAPLSSSVSNTVLEEACVITPFAAFDEDALKVAPVQISDELAERLVDVNVWFATEAETAVAIIGGFLDEADKGAMFAKSKMKKSLLGLQMALSVATGNSFIGFNVPKPRRVLYIQLEIKAGNMHKRFRMVARSMDVGPSAVGGRLYVLNGRGTNITLEQIAESTKRCHADLVIVDPLYKLDSGDEGAEALARILSGFDQIIEKTGAALLYIHHDKKGSVGELDSVDRGSGHGIVGRDYDSAIMLTRHENGEDTLAEFVCRNYAQPDARCLVWQDFHFDVDADASSTPETSRTLNNRRSRGPTIAQLADQAGEMLDVGDSVQVDTFRCKLQDALSIGQNKARDVIRVLQERAGFTTERTKTFPSNQLITRVS